MLRGIIFDSGGTLIDTSAWDSSKAHKRYVDILHSMGFKTEVKEWKKAFAEASESIEERYKGSPMRHQVGVVFMETCRHLRFRIDPAIATSMDFQVQNSLVGLASNYEDTLSTLEHVKSLGLLTCMVANGTVIRTNRILEALKLRPYMDFVVVSEHVGYEKYTGIPFKRALAQMQMTPDEVLAVGDNPEEDVVGAKKAGLRTVHIGSHERCRKFSPDFCIEELAELKQIVKKLSAKAVA